MEEREQVGGSDGNKHGVSNTSASPRTVSSNKDPTSILDWTAGAGPEQNKEGVEKSLVENAKSGEESFPTECIVLSLDAEKSADKLSNDAAQPFLERDSQRKVDGVE